jgi:hypothetical protein
MQNGLPEQVAIQIKTRLLDNPTYQPSSISELSIEYKVSYKTMLKAIHLLAKEKVILCRKGRKISRADSVSPQQHVYDTPVGRLFGRVRNAIMDGVYHTGYPLPKFDYFVVTEHVSRDTVSGALRMLAKENLAHKRGKRWIAGPRPMQSRSGTGPGVLSQAPVVLVLTANDSDAYALFNSTHTAPFINVFSGELVKQGIQLSLVQRTASAIGLPHLPQGIEEVRAHIKRLGDRYRGALTVDLGPSIDTFSEWLPCLSNSGTRPVIYFDFSDEAPYCTRSRLPYPDCYYRMFFDENSMLTIGLKRLIATGHSTFGFPTLGGKGEHWTLRRLEKAQRIAALLPGRIRIITSSHNEPFWYPESATNIDKFINFNRRVNALVQDKAAPPGKAANFQQKLLECTPSMVALFQQDITALVSLNDTLAHLQYLWCRLAGIDVPRHLSMLSFDNIPQSAIFPIATVDFGFSRLGYLASHILAGDISVQCDKEGNIPGECTIIERGSIASPGAEGRAQALVR